MALNVLFVGGTGQISLPCVKLAVEAGHNVTVFNRGKSGERLPRGVTVIEGDMSKSKSYSKLGAENWDVVAQFMAFTPDQVAQDIATFAGKTGHYLFISSASVYLKPARDYLITEKTPAINPFWPYSQAKIACEELLKKSKNLPWTIVRPSHTVRNGLPTIMNEGDIVGHRMLQGKAVIVAGDGTIPWTLTRSADFAVPFVRLFGNKETLKETYHITGDKGFTWDAIYKAIGKGLGVEPKIVHIPTDTLVQYHPEWAGPLLGDKTWASLFDNSKVKAVVGDFKCADTLDVILKDSIAYFKKRAVNGAPRSPFSTLMNRIAREQQALG